MNAIWRRFEPKFQRVCAVVGAPRSEAFDQTQADVGPVHFTSFEVTSSPFRILIVWAMARWKSLSRFSSRLGNCRDVPRMPPVIVFSHSGRVQLNRTQLYAVRETAMVSSRHRNCGRFGHTRNPHPIQR
jgi:hypothetical protein